ncbi:precorrin-2 dehydrogenase/sirohydrochlorin ferrochelatase family protein [Carboxylicivirga marina]|uniref:precorrin-2 dehydrogenase n=1 Tax=Carboxylicivirga marina TaxID=2800988 RepID=A0ABS1HK89_9BACT|nr:bifunctional precorrin-2 dehydrogenase/sirohydrochlorin ferrochelatase [Carboxylicivirga marina]MBK3518080.1 bifunctional precorrin-2 dehydrogenase/sirohydrochlorin ferrochelatase [Carboxylicivirga marina]
MKFYPIHLDIKNKPCLVVGGGKVAQRKVIKLCQAGAAVTVISKELTPDLKVLNEQKQFKYLNRHYHTGDVNDFFLVFAATNNLELNKQIIRGAKSKQVLSNRINGVDEGDFILPATCQVGDLHIGITTQGQSPALSARMRRYFMQKLSTLTPEEIEAVADVRRQMLISDNEKDKVDMMTLVDEIIHKIESNPVEPDKL